MWRARGNDNITTIIRENGLIILIDISYLECGTIRGVFITFLVGTIGVILLILRTLHLFSPFCQNYEFFVSSRSIKKKPILQRCVILILRESTLSGLYKRYRICR